MRKKSFYALLSASLCAIAIAIFSLLYATTETNAGPIYMAGLKNGDICECPKMVGDCVCKVNPPIILVEE